MSNLDIFHNLSEYMDSFYESFKTDYMDETIPVSKIMEKYNLKSGVHNKFVNLIADETGYRRREFDSLRSDYVKHDVISGSYQILYSVDGKEISYGYYNNKRNALKIVRELRKVKWDKSKLLDIQEELNIYPTQNAKTMNEKYRGFKKGYMEGLPLNELIENYELSYANYQRFIKHIFEETGYSRIERDKDMDHINAVETPKYVHYDVFKNNSYHWSARFNTLYDAKRFRFEWMNVGFDKDKVQSIIEKLNLEEWDAGYEYIHKNGNYYAIQKGDIFYGQFYNYETTERVRDELINYNWDEEKLPEILEKLCIKRPSDTFKYYTYDKKRDYYIVNRKVNGEYISFVVNSEQDAKIIVKALNKIDWDKSKMYKVLKDLNIEIPFTEKKNYYEKFGKWHVEKKIDGEMKKFGVYGTEKDAKMVAEFLKLNNWKRDGLPQFRKENKILRYRRDKNGRYSQLRND